MRISTYVPNEEEKKQKQKPKKKANSEEPSLSAQKTPGQKKAIYSRL
jgi:hypothetical protein